MLLGFLFGHELGKSSEKERLAKEHQKLKEDELNALKEQYMLELLMPVRGQETFKLAVHQPSLFEFYMVKKLLKRIESPVKYFKYYKVGNTYVLEGYSTSTEEYKSWESTDVKQNTFFAASSIILYILAYILNEYVFHLGDKGLFFLVLYHIFAFSGSLTLGGLGCLLLFPQKDGSIREYGKL